MLKKIFTVAAGLTVSMGLSVAAVAADKIKITTLEWPPYTGAELPGEGSTLTKIRDAFAKSGIEVEFEFTNWQRAVALGTTDAGYAGVTPMYYAASRDSENGGEGCKFSKAFDTGTTGMIFKKGNGFDWSSVEDLEQFRIGVVAGYKNEETFDKLVADGKIKTNESRSELQVIQKVAAGRVDAGLIDLKLYEHLAANDAKAKAAAGKIDIHAKPLIEHGLYICFPDEARSDALRAAFDGAL